MADLSDGDLDSELGEIGDDSTLGILPSTPRAQASRAFPTPFFGLNQPIEPVQLSFWNCVSFMGIELVLKLLTIFHSKTESSSLPYTLYCIFLDMMFSLALGPLKDKVSSFG